MSDSKQSSQIKVFSSSNCGYCQMVKAYFRSKGVEFQELDVSDDQVANEAFELTNQRVVPVILFEKTNNVVIGFNRNLIDKYLEEQ